MIELQKQKTKRSVATQTGSDDDLYFYISDNKNAKVYYSINEKEKLFRLTANTKSVALNKEDWKKFRNFINQIDSLMLKDE